MSGGYYVSKCKKIIQIKEMCLLFSLKPWHDVKPSFLFSLPPTTGSATGDYLWVIWIRFVVKGSLYRAGTLSPVLETKSKTAALYTAAGKCCTPCRENNFTPPWCAVYYDSLFCPIIDRDWRWVHVNAHMSACKFLPGKPRLWID